MEVKREAEITRQIREDDPPPQDAELSDIREEDESMGSYGDDGARGISFSKQAQKHGGFWFGDQMEGLSGSPPQFPGLRMSTDGDIMVRTPLGFPFFPSFSPRTHVSALDEFRIRRQLPRR